MPWVLVRQALGFGCFCKHGSNETWGGWHQPMGLNTGVAKRQKKARWVPSVPSVWFLIFTDLSEQPHFLSTIPFVSSCLTMVGCTLELSVKIIPFSLQLLLVGHLVMSMRKKYLIHVYLIQVWVFHPMPLHQLWFFSWAALAASPRILKICQTQLKPKI